MQCQLAGNNIPLEISRQIGEDPSQRPDTTVTHRFSLDLRCARTAGSPPLLLCLSACACVLTEERLNANMQRKSLSAEEIAARRAIEEQIRKHQEEQQAAEQSMQALLQETQARAKARVEELEAKLTVTSQRLVRLVALCFLLA